MKRISRSTILRGKSTTGTISGYPGSNSFEVQSINSENLDSQENHSIPNDYISSNTPLSNITGSNLFEVPVIGSECTGSQHNPSRSKRKSTNTPLSNITNVFGRNELGSNSQMHVEVTESPFNDGIHNFSMTRSPTIVSLDLNQQYGFHTPDCSNLFEVQVIDSENIDNQHNPSSDAIQNFSVKRCRPIVSLDLNQRWGVDNDLHTRYETPFLNDVVRETTEILENMNQLSDIDERMPIVQNSNYWDIGECDLKCTKCGSFFWWEERVISTSSKKLPLYSLCCKKGKIKLAQVREPPKVLHDLLTGNDAESKEFQYNIRSYNCMFSFTSLGGKVKKDDSPGRAPRTFIIGGKNCHLIGSLLPNYGESPVFAQLYIYDTQQEDFSRIKALRNNIEDNNLRIEIVSKIRSMLDEHNILVQSFRMVRDRLMENDARDISLRLIGKRFSDPTTYNLPTVNEVAALVVGDYDVAFGERDILVESRSGKLKRISQLNPSYLALQYPLLFPYDEDGYREDIPFSNFTSTNVRGRTSVSIREFLSYKFHERFGENPFILRSRRLLQEICVDGYTMVESSRIAWISTHQKKLRCEMYNRFTDSVLTGDRDSSTKGKRVILPATFVGGARYMIQNYQDAMAICRWTGYPDLFLTFTCKPKWPEIDRYLRKRNLNPEDRPDVLCRIFNIKLNDLIRFIKKKKIFGMLRAVIYTVEYQKRGLPHAHILLFLGPMHKIPTPGDIDRYISAEQPDKEREPGYFKAVSDFMLHGPCGQERPKSPCMKEGRCSKHFPKQFNEATCIDEEGYPRYRRSQDGRFVMRKGIPLDNRFVVPHNKDLLLRYGGHLNVEWCNQSRSIKYLFKYVNKGNDRVTAGFYNSAKDRSNNETSQINEIDMYYDCRYISPCEAIWRIFGFPIQYKFPSVERLGFHLPNEHLIFFEDDDDAMSVVRRESIKESKFIEWMNSNIHYADARTLTYAEFPQKFVWKDDIRKWMPRQRGVAIGRITYIPPGSGEAYYLRILLNVIRGPRTYEEIRTINGVIHPTFRDACYALGLLDDDKEYIDGLTEASYWASASQLRLLFVTLLINESMSKPRLVWDSCSQYLSDDIVCRQRRALNHPGLQLSTDDILDYTLVEMEILLNARGKSLKDYHEMPLPNRNLLRDVGENRLIYDELQYDIEAQRYEFQNLITMLNTEQRLAYDRIMQSVETKQGGVFFLYGYGGTGKTFMWRTLSASIRSKGEIVLNVASSGIASLLLPGGRTSHSRFAIPLVPNENSTCNIKQGSSLAQLIIRASLIVWDEAPMTHRYCFEALDRSLQDVMRIVREDCVCKPFGGKTIVFGGDFRQILPVIPKGRRPDIVNTTINSSYIWANCTVLRLTENMRLRGTNSEEEFINMRNFAEWIASIGDGVTDGMVDGCREITIPPDMLLEYTDDPISNIVRATYPDFDRIANDPKYLQDRAILAPTLDVVDEVNDYMISLNTNSECFTYLSSDSICKSDTNVDVLSDLHSPEYLNNIKVSGVPNHRIILKVGTPIMLLRNIDQTMGLCNGTRLIVTRLGTHVIQGKIIAGKYSGQEVVIPRLSLTPPDTRIPFKFQRKQFPIMISYAMTINKSQGQSLSNVGLLLKKHVFSHGQLYVALSRVTNRQGLKILIVTRNNNSKSHTENVVYREVFRNL